MAVLDDTDIHVKAARHQFIAEDVLHDVVFFLLPEVEQSSEGLFKIFAPVRSFSR
ncbi:hypothetical protein [Duodenibacillus massiliensis]|uniref:hypothetical protein n=1 Tax=Duodenibacillus massiliensis TaxID=1852381 RepID=UPI002FDB5791